MNDDISPSQGAYHQPQAYELNSSPAYNTEATQQQYTIKQEVILQGERRGCLAHLCDGSL